MTNYIATRKRHPFWPFYETQHRDRTPIALQELREMSDGTAVLTSHVGVAQIEKYLGTFYETPDEWPITLQPAADEASSQHSAHAAHVEGVH